MSRISFKKFLGQEWVVGHFRSNEIGSVLIVEVGFGKWCVKLQMASFLPLSLSPVLWPLKPCLLHLSGTLKIKSYSMQSKQLNSFLLRLLIGLLWKYLLFYNQTYSFILFFWIQTVLTSWKILPSSQSIWIMQSAFDITVFLLPQNSKICFTLKQKSWLLFS